MDYHMMRLENTERMNGHMDEKQEGIIFNIQRFSTHDGPGIRTTVFLKGCPLCCFWCQNPESQQFSSVLMHNIERCTGCGTCAGVCPVGAVSLVDGKASFRRDLCITCGLCEDNCSSNALSVSGVKMTVEAVLREVLKDRNEYLNSGGGVTLSGGEPLSQKDFAVALLQRCKAAGLHTVVETCGFVPEEALREAATFTDCFFFDIKCLDAKKHTEWTRQSNGRILENAAWLAKSGAEIQLRMPLIPGFNDTEDDVKALLRFAEGIGLSGQNVSLLQYNKLGESKYESIGRAEEMRPMQPQSDEAYKHLVSLLSVPSVL
jgi:pyruvate formate lyase activating enzyme